MKKKVLTNQKNSHNIACGSKKPKDKDMKLSHELGKIFEKEMDAVIEQEIKDVRFLHQEQFPNCESRAAAMVAIATTKVAKTLALSICSHREEKHEEDHSDEIARLKPQLSPDEIEVGTYGWWGH